MGLFDNVLGAGESLIKNEDVLDYDYIPPELPYRENEQHYLATCIKPLFQSRSGRNLFIYGAPGIGKTVAVKHVLNELEEQTQDIHIVYVNCWKYNTSYKILVSLCEQLGYRFTQNKKTTELLQKATQLINQQSAVLVFDEIDKADDFDFLYSLVEEVYKKVIFLLTNYKSWLFELDERIRSRLVIEMQEFRAYSATETKGILQDRVAQGFVQGVWEPDAFNLVARKTAEIKDIRSGLFLLKESGLLAEEDSSKKITKNHVQQAIAKLEEFSSKATKELDEESQFILSLIKNNSGKKIGELFELYQQHQGTNSYKTFQRKINKLGEGNYVKLTKKSGAGGNTTIVEKKFYTT